MSLRMTTLPTALRIRVVSYALGAYKVYIEGRWYKLRRGLITLVIKLLEDFLRFRVIRTLYFPKIHVIEVLIWPFVVVKLRKELI